METDHAPHQLLNYQITRLPNCSSVRLVLRFHVTGFAAGTAVILAVFTKANVKLRPAKPAVLDAGAAAFSLLTENADKVFGHGR